MNVNAGKKACEHTVWTCKLCVVPYVYQESLSRVGEVRMAADARGVEGF